MNEDGRTAPTMAASSSGAISTSTLGEVLADRYEILGLVGVGGMGSVYRAKDRELDEIVAVKTLRRELVETPGMIERFRREVKLARRVTHKNIARVFDIGEHRQASGAIGDRFLTMEFVEGESLGAKVARGTLPLGDVVEITTAICAGLSAAHAAGVVHRDLKPDNVLLAKDGRVVVTDFGIARALEGFGDASSTIGVMLGTPAYMAPEQVEHGKEIDARTDVYALGALLFELVTGKRAWSGDAPLAVAAARLVSPPPDPRKHRPDLPSAFAETILKCMQRHPEHRFAAAREVIDALSNVTLPAPAVVSVAPPRLTTPPPVSSPTPNATNQKTVAVLPFKNGGAADDAYLAEELTDDLIDALSMTRGLRVTSRGPVNRFAQGDRDARAIGKELGVQVVVDGSVRRGNGRVRVASRLLSVEDGFQIWAKRFDRPEQEILQVNDEVASAIAQALTVEEGVKARQATDDPIAIDLYLRGRQAYRKYSPEGARAAKELFEQALARAPDDPTILAGLASAESRLAFFEGEGLERARVVAERAVAAGPEHPDPHFALGSIEMMMGNTAEAVRHIRFTLARAPGHAEAHASLGRWLVEAGMLEEGIKRLEAALAIDPQVPLATGQLGRAYALLGDWKRAEELTWIPTQSESVMTAFTNVARLTLWRRDPEAVKRLLERQLPAELPPIGLSASIVTFLRTGDLDASFERLLVQSGGMNRGSVRRRAFFRQLEAEFRGYIHDTDKVLEAVRASIEANLLDLAWMDRCPLLDGARARPEFAELRAQVKERAEKVTKAYFAAWNDPNTRAP